MSDVSKAVSIAQRFIEYYSLRPPVDVKRIIESKAKLVVTNIPFRGVDGLALNLKVRGKETIVVVNSSAPPLRQRFTMAHELGHIVIPWHIGNVIDSVDNNSNGDGDDYYDIESQANAFAGELLMPSDFVLGILASGGDIAKAHCELAERCEVSLHAAAMQLVKFLPSNYTYAVDGANVVEFSGRTNGTVAPVLDVGSDLAPDAYSYCDHHYMYSYSGRTVHWWELPNSFDAPEEDDREWRSVLDSMIEDIGIPFAERATYKKSINGVFASANSMAIRTGTHTFDAVAAICLQRIMDRVEYRDFSRHPDLKVFISKRALDFVKRR